MRHPANTPDVAPTPALDGARVVWRHWQSHPATACEGWLREFSPDGRRVRICATQNKRERGHWHECRQIRIVALLNADTAPDESKPDKEGDDE